jgi:hypothetical protein
MERLTESPSMISENRRLDDFRRKSAEESLLTTGRRMCAPDIDGIEALPMIVQCAAIVVQGPHMKRAFISVRSHFFQRAYEFGRNYVKPTLF